MPKEPTDTIDPTSDYLWFTVSEVAKQKGVSKQAVSKRIIRLEALGAIETRLGSRGAKLVNIASYDRAVGETGDAIRAMNAKAAHPSTPNGGGGSDPILAREQARHTAYRADIARLDLEERLKNLLPADEVATAIDVCKEAILRRIDQLHDRADDVAAAVAKDGAQGARMVLKTIVRDLRSSIERELRKLVESGSAPPPPDARLSA